MEVAREGTQIARVSEPGSVFGELAVLLDRPHTADVRAVERSEFSIADAATLLTDPAATLYIAAILAAPGRRQRRSHRGQAPAEIGKPRAAIAQTVDKIADLLARRGKSCLFRLSL